MSKREADAGVLIEAARQHVADVLAPLLPPERRYDVAMVQNALAIAARLVAGPDEAARVDQEALRNFYAARGEVPQGDLSEALARDLRAGRLDDALATAVPAALRPGVVSRLARSNPKAAAPREVEG